jgi:cytochrome c biogenesis protein CcmG, thiol:disulfide interchange protein DsbE
VLQIVAGGPVVADGSVGAGGGGGGGAKFWVEAGAATPSTIAKPSATTEVRRMGYYTAMLRRLLILLVIAALPAAAHAAPAAPGFKVTTLDGQTIDSRDLIGKKIIVLRFQASYCKPCVKESAAFGRVVERYRDRDVTFVAVHVQDAMSDVRRFMKANKVTYPIGVDPKLNLGNRYGFKGSPYTVVIDRTGEIVQRWAGESVPSRLPKLLDSLLKPTTS